MLPGLGDRLESCSGSGSQGRFLGRQDSERFSPFTIAKAKIRKGKFETEEVKIFQNPCTEGQ